jgi:hypothetical protein
MFRIQIQMHPDPDPGFAYVLWVNPDPDPCFYNKNLEKISKFSIKILWKGPPILKGILPAFLRALIIRNILISCILFLIYRTKDPDSESRSSY